MDFGGQGKGPNSPARGTLTRRPRFPGRKSYSPTWSSSYPFPVWHFTPDPQGLWLIRYPVPRNITTQCRLYEAVYTTEVRYLDNIPPFNTSSVYGGQILGTAMVTTMPPRQI